MSTFGVAKKFLIINKAAHNLITKEVNKMNLNSASTLISCNRCGYSSTDANVIKVHMEFDQKKCNREINKRKKNNDVVTLKKTIVEEISEIDFKLAMLNRDYSKTPNFCDVISEMKFPMQLFEKIYKKAYGADLVNPQPTKNIQTSFRFVVGQFLFDFLLSLKDNLPFFWSYNTSFEEGDKARKILFVRHDNKWIPQTEKNWKLAFAFSEIDAEDEDVLSSIVYQIVSNFLTDIMLGLREHQVSLVKKGVEINSLKALIDFEDDHLITKFYFLTVFLSSDFSIDILSMKK